jgi:hypothetical protein
METKTDPRNAFYAQTLEEMISAAEIHAAELDLTISLGEIWRLRKLDDSCRGFAALDKLAYFHKHLTAELSRLRSWLAMNEYATTQPLSEILTNWSGGSAALMALIEAGLVAQHYEATFEFEVPDLVEQIASALDR